jgi:restriction endonuclease
LETKGTSNEGEMRRSEEAKIACGRKHFKALSDGDNDGVALHTAKDWRGFKRENAASFVEG